MITGFLVGLGVSLIAAIPAVGLLMASRGREFKTMMRNWALGMVLRFLIIGGALYLIFTESELNRMPVIWGVVTMYFLVFAVEAVTMFGKGSKTQELKS